MRHLHSIPLPILIAIAVVVVILVCAALLRFNRQPKRPPVRLGGGTPSSNNDQSRPRQRPNQQ